MCLYNYGTKQTIRKGLAKMPFENKDIQYQAPDSWSEYTTPFDDIIK